jgi:AraC-like DNA-binding protein
MLLRSGAFRRLCDARDLLAQFRDEPLPIREVAQAVRISPFHFIRQFEALFGMTPHQFRIHTRLEQAKLLLTRKHHSVTEVCLEVGVSSLGSFSDLFARRAGVSPSAYNGGRGGWWSCRATRRRVCFRVA